MISKYTDIILIIILDIFHVTIETLSFYHCYMTYYTTISIRQLKIKIDIFRCRLVHGYTEQMGSIGFSGAFDVFHLS